MTAAAEPDEGGGASVPIIAYAFPVPIFRNVI